MNALLKSFGNDNFLMNKIAGVKIPENVDNLLAITQYLSQACSSSYDVIILIGGKKNIMLVTSEDVPQSVRTLAESLLFIDDLENKINMLSFGKN